MFDVTTIRKDFPMLQSPDKEEANLVYFDNAATTFKPQIVIDALTGKGFYDFLSFLYLL